MMNDVLISIIVPLYNGQKWIRRTVQSFFSKTYHRNGMRLSLWMIAQQTTEWHI